MTFPKSVKVTDCHCIVLGTDVILYVLDTNNLLTYRSKTTLFVDPLTLSVAILLFVIEATLDALTQGKDMSRCFKIPKDTRRCEGKCEDRYVGEGKAASKKAASARPYRAFYPGKAAALRGHCAHLLAFAGSGVNCIRCFSILRLAYVDSPIITSAMQRHSLPPLLK